MQFQYLLRKVVAYRFAIALAVAATPLSLLSTRPALAACAPLTGVVVPGDTVVCTTTTNQDAPNGYGTGVENGLTINVLSGATLTGTDNGLSLDSNNTVNNAGTITTLAGGLNGILAQGPVTIVNASAGTISSQGGGSSGIAGPNLLITNFGTISATGAGSFAIDATFGAATVTLDNSGTVTGPRAITVGTGNITNRAGGTIQSTAGVTISLVDGSIDNAGSITGTTGAISGQNLTISNTGTITSNGTIASVNLDNGTITNAGTIVSTAGGSRAVAIDANATLNNSGTIASNVTNGSAVFVNNGGFATINNSGSISATSTGGIGVEVDVNAQANITNTGRIVGRTGVFVTGGAGLGTNLVNAGTIIGTGGTAIDFSASDSNSLTIMAGSRIIGQVLLGTNDSIIVRAGSDISSLLTFCACGGITTSVTGGLPYAISGTQIAVLEPTAIGVADRNIAAFTGMITSLISDRFNEASAPATAGARVSAFAPTGTGVAETASAAFDHIPALMYAREYQGSVRNATVTSPQSGMSVWSKAFVGARHQRADGAMLPSDTLAYGGALGADKSFGHRIRLGAFIGAGRGKLDVDLNSQSVKTDYMFGGVYFRLDRVTHFFDVAMTGGITSNDSTRQVAHNLAPAGQETATASYNGWFVSPEFTYGVRIPVASNATLTPSVKFRYIGGHQSVYTEAGSSQTLTVNARTSHNLEQRIEFALSQIREMNGGSLKTTFTVGALGLERIGGNTVSTVLIGQNLSFAAPGDNLTGGLYAGVGFDVRFNERMGAFVSTEGTVMSDKSTLGTAKSGVRVTF